MKLRKGLSLLLGGAIISLLASTTYAASWEEKDFANKGGLKTVHIYNPETSSPIGDGKALLMVLRGCSQPATRFKEAGLDEAADTYGMVIAAAEPNVPHQMMDCWNYFSGTTSRTSGDYKYIIETAQAMINDPQYDIDPDQVYISGLSSGGAFAMTVGCLAPDIFAGMGLDAAPSIGSGTSTSTPVGTPQTTADKCTNAAGTNSKYFATQITSTAFGTTDGLVGKDYAPHNAAAMALIYNASKTNKQNIVQNIEDVIEYTWTDGRVSMVEFGGVGHAWPGGPDATGGLMTYIDSSSANYGLYLGKYFSENNIRVPDEDEETCKNITLDAYDYNPETKVFTASGTATEDCQGAVVYINVADSADYQAPSNDEYSFTIQNVTCPDEIKVTLENASRESFTTTDIFTGSCGETKIPPVVESFNAITSKGSVTLTGMASDADGTVVSATIAIDQTEYDVDVNDNGVFALSVDGLAARRYYANVIVMDDDALTANKLIEFTIEESEKLAPRVTLDPIEIYKDYAVQCGVATDADGEIEVAVYTIDGEGKTINTMNPDGSFCIHLSDLEPGEHVLTIVIADNDKLGTEKVVTFTISDEELLPPTVHLKPVEIDGQTAVISGTASDADGEVLAATVTINGTEYPVALNAGEFTITLTDLDAGSYHVVATATDNDQQQGSDTIDFEIEEIEKLPPTVSVNTSVDGTSVTISGTASDVDGDIVEVVVSVNGTDYTVANGNYSKTLTDLAAGSYDVVVTATDSDDLTATATTSFTIEEEEEEEEEDNVWTSWWDWWMGFWSF